MKKPIKKNKKKENTQNENINKKQKNNEFLYIDEIDLKTELVDKKYVVIDPGKRDLLTIMSPSGETMVYSNAQRIHDTKRLKYQKLIMNFREKLKITELEEKLKGLNSKTCDIENFKKYCKIKNEINKQLLPFYQNKQFRKYQWYSYINTKRADQKMCQQIADKFGNDIIIIHGDWSQGKQMRNFLSTPNIGIKRKLKESFKVYNMDEYKTSKLHYETEEKCENMVLLDKTGKSRRQHSILTYIMENGRLGCINRDRNACLNMIKLVAHFLKTGERMKKYCRGFKEEPNDVKNDVITNKSSQPLCIH